MEKCYSSANILLPDFKVTDAEKWAVVACDQFTSEASYWEETDRLVGDAPSTLRVILPEAYLEEASERIPQINKTMEEYLSDVLHEHSDSMIYTERTQSDGSIRRGIVMAIDLECYDFRRSASSLIRSTEATVMERIPPRVAIRRDAKIELPHVMLLIDDPKHTVIEPLSAENCPTVAYDTQLMQKGGHIIGRFLSVRAMNSVSDALDALITPSAMAERYGKDGLCPIMFAVGDGNHSLATAKTIYEELKASLGEDAAKAHPARYALVEVVNIHDEAMKFEPIYRVLFGVDTSDVTKKLREYADTLCGTAPKQTVEYVSAGGNGTICIDNPEKTLTVATLQDFIDGYIKENPSVTVDYIHGEASVKKLASAENSIGFLFSGMAKDELFKTVIFDGALPRKTFSMGHAEDKRYYLEARLITK